ncbi:unnamed protein product [Musa acuminata var. zebrina]
MASLTTTSTVEVDNPSRDMTATSKIFGGVDLRAHLPNPKPRQEEEEEEDMMDNSKRNKSSNTYEYLTHSHRGQHATRTADRERLKTRFHAPVMTHKAMGRQEKKTGRAGHGY